MKRMKTNSRYMSLIYYLRKKVRLYSNVNIVKVQFKDMKKEILFFLKIELNGRKKREKTRR